MDSLHSIEIAINIFLQSLGSGLLPIMKALSFLGQEEFYLLLMPVLYWCVDAALGLRMGVMLLLAQSTNSIFKTLLREPRPFWYDPGVRALAVETSFGAPSGHAQSSAGIFGLLAAGERRRWLRWAWVALVFLIGVSRLYLGMHFLSDVLAGWLLGAILLWAFLRFEQPLTNWLRGLHFPQHLALAAFSSVGMIMLSLLVVAIPGGDLPAAWMQNAGAATPGVEIDPFSIEGMFTIGGTWFGLLGGLAWFWQRHGMFDAGGAPGQRLLRYLVGLVGVLVLWYGLGAVFPRSADWIGYSLRYLRYTLVGLWITAGAPLVFARLALCQLADRHNAQPNLTDSAEL